METELLLFVLPLQAGIQKSAESMQKELINLKCNADTNQKFAEMGFQGESSRRKFPVLGSFVSRMTAICSNTYKSVQFFTFMYNNKTKNRSVLTDGHLYYRVILSLEAPNYCL